MRVAYVVLSYRDQPQVARLVAALRRGDPAGTVLLHHDPVLAPFDVGLVADWTDVHLLTAREPVPWGSFRLVEVVLDCLRVATEDLGADWVMLLSGDDYPVRPLEELVGLLASTSCDALLEFTRTAAGAGRPPRDAGAGMYRYRYRAVPRLPDALTRRLTAVVPQSLRARALAAATSAGRWQGLVSIKSQPRGLPVLVGWRRFRDDYRPGRLKFHKGRNFFAVSAKAAQSVLELVAARPDYVAHYRRTCIPTESFFHTLLAGAPELSVCDRDLHYESWGPLDASPAVLRREDLADALASGCYFARKFDRSQDADVLDDLDRRLAGAD